MEIIKFASEEEFNDFYKNYQVKRTSSKFGGESVINFDDKKSLS